MIGERISPTIDPYTVVIEDGIIYANSVDAAMRKPVDLAQYIYCHAHWMFRPMSSILDFEVWYDYSRKTISVEVLPAKGFVRWTAFNEEEATAPDAIAGLVRQRLGAVRDTVEPECPTTSSPFSDAAQQAS